MRSVSCSCEDEVVRCARALGPAGGALGMTMGSTGPTAVDTAVEFADVAALAQARVAATAVAQVLVGSLVEGV